MFYLTLPNYRVATADFNDHVSEARLMFVRDDKEENVRLGSVSSGRMTNVSRVYFGLVNSVKRIRTWWTAVATSWMPRSS